MTGVITLSVEIELGWGYHDLDHDGRVSDDRKQEDVALRRLLDRCDELDIPFTFDVVGHLFQNRRPTYDSPHPDGWFDGVPDGPDPTFYAPDMIERVKQTDVNHELCTHTYSHTLCSQADPDVVAWDLQRAADAHRAADEPAPVSLVPPRHSPPPRDVLRDAGIEIVRTVGYDREPSRVRKFRRLLFEPPAPKAPRLVDGIVETYCAPFTTLTASSLASGSEPPLAMFRAVPRRLRQRLHERYLTRAVEKAAEQDSYTHLWCHLHDMANDSQWPPIQAFLGTLAELRDRGEVEILPMVALNDRVRDRPRETDRQADDQVVQRPKTP